MKFNSIWSSGTGYKKTMMALLLIVLLLVPEAYFSLQPGTAEASGAQLLGDLQIGDRVVDLSWEWEFKTGASYSGTGEIKPVTWIVVAKDHYGVGSGVTLLSEELIGLFAFDNSTDRGDDNGSNHWADSGTPNATHGLRPWLNSSGIHSTEGFYLAFSEMFKDNIITTNVPNKEWEAGDPYITQDRVFISSSTELGDSSNESTYEVGTVYPYFTGAVNADRIAELGGTAKNYWTRSPDSRWTEHVRQVGASGVINNFFALTGYNAVRPALNLSADSWVSEEANADGIYVLVKKPIITLGDLDIGDRVVDLSWEWEFRTDRNYTGMGETKAVVWVVVAKDHYKMSPGVTLISEELIGCFTFDNSATDGSNHWGESGTGKETRGLRPWLNSTGTYTGEGFYQAFSEKFKDAIVTVSLPNKGWETGLAYTTLDQVFIPSTTELGDAAHIHTYEIGTAFPYFSQSTDKDRIAKLGGINQAYWTRSPDSRSAENVRRVSTSGSFDAAVARDGYGAVRPGVTLSSLAPVSRAADNKKYILFGESPLYGDVNGDGQVDVGDAILLLRHIVGLIDIEAEFGPEALTRAKVSGGEGAVDVGDAILILRYIVGLITKFPVEG